MPGSNANGFAWQWNIGLRFLSHFRNDLCGIAYILMLLLILCRDVLSGLDLLFPGVLRVLRPPRATRGRGRHA